jgi:FixJ family two-component response regulator
MPGMNGQSLATHLQALRPDLKCLFMSGYTAEMLVSDNVLPEGVHFIPKPFTTRELNTKIREALDGRPIKK